MENKSSVEAHTTKQSLLETFTREYTDQNGEVQLFSDTEIQNFLDQRVLIQEYNDQTILYVDFDHHEHTNIKLVKLVENLLKDRAEYLMVEYFSHELIPNAKKSIFSFVLPRVLSQDRMTRNRILGTDKFIRYSGENNIPIAIADIASTPLYEATYHLWILLPILFYSLVIPEKSKISVGNENLFVSMNTQFLLMLLTGIYRLLISYQEEKKKGIFSKEPVFNESMYFDMEDARRVFTAKGIQVLTKIIQEKRRFSNTPTKDIVVIEPMAHSTRVKNYVKTMDKFREILYQLPVYLDFNLRVYERNDERKRFESIWKGKWEKSTFSLRSFPFNLFGKREIQ